MFAVHFFDKNGYPVPLLRNSRGSACYRERCLKLDSWHSKHYNISLLYGRKQKTNWFSVVRKNFVTVETVFVNPAQGTDSAFNGSLESFDRHFTGKLKLVNDESN